MKKKQTLQVNNTCKIKNCESCECSNKNSQNPQNTIGKKIKRAVITTALLALYMAVAWFITGTSCFLSSTTGLPCPGCGLTRAWQEAFSLNFKEAFLMHPLFFIPPLFLVFWLIVFIKHKHKHPKYFEIILWTTLGMFMGLYVVRMILYFPHSEPMKYNFDSFTWRIIEGLKWLFGFRE